MRRVFSWVFALAAGAIFASGLPAYLLTRRTPWHTYVGFRVLFCLSNGRVNDLATGVSRLLHRSEPIEPIPGVMPVMSQARVQSIAQQIAATGYYVFPKKLDAGLCAELTEFALRTPATPVGASGATA